MNIPILVDCIRIIFIPIDCWSWCTHRHRRLLLHKILIAVSFVADDIAINITIADNIIVEIITIKIAIAIAIIIVEIAIAVAIDIG